MNETINESQPIRIRVSKYNSENERHNAIKAQKRMWYHANADLQKLKSLKSYYVNQLKKNDLKEEIKTKYESKLNEINNQLNSLSSKK